MELQQIFLMYLPILELFPKSPENERLARVWFYVCFCVSCDVPRCISSHVIEEILDF